MPTPKHTPACPPRWSTPSQCSLTEVNSAQRCLCSHQPYLGRDLSQPCVQEPLTHQTTLLPSGLRLTQQIPPPQRTPDSQLEALIVLGGPAVVLGFGCKLAFLVAEMGPNDVDFNERPENARSLPLEVIGSHHYWRKWRRRLVRFPQFGAMVCKAYLKDYISQHATSVAMVMA